MKSLSLEIPWNIKSTLALGADMKRSFALGENRQITLFYSRKPLSTVEEALDFKEEVLGEIKRRGFQPRVVVGDLHPRYLSTRTARELHPDPVLVQHHRAHIASALAEHGITEEVIGISMDGTGYGEDGGVWGGEFFVGEVEELTRVGHIEYFPLQGGDSAARETWRPALALIDLISPERAEKMAAEIGPRAKVVLAALRKGLGVVPTSSAGRLFDAAAFLILGIRENSYEAEAPMALEKAGSSCPSAPPYRFALREDGEKLLLDPLPAFEEILTRKESPERMALSFHRGLARGIAEVAFKLRERTGIKKLVFSGGVFQNNLLTGLLKEEAKNAGFEPVFHRRVPAHDGGIALGQAVLGGLG